MTRRTIGQDLQARRCRCHVRVGIALLCCAALILFGPAACRADRWPAVLGPLFDDDCAVQVNPHYYGEVFSNTRGGRSTNDATRYQGLLDLSLTLDLDAFATHLPGQFFMLAQNTHGQGLTDCCVGDTQTFSNIDSFNNIMRVNEYWWEFDLASEAVTVRLGKQDLNSEFLLIDLAEGFINSSFGLTPASTLPTYPNPSMAAVLLAELNEFWRLKLGVWDALAFGGGWGVSGNDTLLAVGELECTYVLFDDRLPGTVAIGGGYLTGGDVAGEVLSGAHGYYIQWEQLIFRESTSTEDVRQGLGLFVGYYPRFFGDSVKEDSVGDSAVAGCVYRGLLPGRDHDVVGAGFAYAELFQGGTNRENVVELFYRARLSSHVVVQPDLQYIASPSGIYRDALVAGLRFELTL